MFRKYLRGQLWTCSMNGEGHEQLNTRPVVIVSNDVGNHYAPIIMVAPCTGKIKRADMPTHFVFTNPDNGINNTVMCEQAFRVDKSKLHKYIGMFDDEEMSEIDKCLSEVFSLNSKVNIANQDVVWGEELRETDEDTYDSEEIYKIKLVGDCDDLGFEKAAKIYGYTIGTIKNYYYKYRKEINASEDKA